MESIQHVLCLNTPMHPFSILCPGGCLAVQACSTAVPLLLPSLFSSDLEQSTVTSGTNQQQASKHTRPACRRSSLCAPVCASQWCCARSDSLSGRRVEALCPARILSQAKPCGMRATQPRTSSPPSHPALWRLRYTIRVLQSSDAVADERIRSWTRSIVQSTWLQCGSTNKEADALRVE
jgi:hypothetical protein